jgi:hypothetical protein
VAVVVEALAMALVTLWVQLGKSSLRWTRKNRGQRGYFTIEECFKRIISFAQISLDVKVRRVKIKALLPLILILSIIAMVSLTTNFATVKAQARPSIFVDPQNNSFTTDTASVGSTFTVNINAADWPDPGVFSFEFKLYYNTTLLQPVPSQTGIPSSAWITAFIAANGTIDPSGFVYESATLLGVENRVGSGTLGIATFKILQAPTTGQTLTCSLSLQGNTTGQVIIVNPDTTAAYAEDYYDVISGTFSFAFSGPAAPTPVLYVDPKDNFFTAPPKSAGDTFTVSVKTVNWSSPGVFGYAFRLTYNSSLLQAVSVNIPADNWLAPANASNIVFYDNGTINQSAGYVSFNVTLLDGEQGKTGGGTIATIAFSISQVPPSGENVACTLGISNVVLMDPSGATISSSQYTIVNGNYKLTSSAGGLVGDLNGDGKVNIEDIALWGAAFGSTPSSSRWNPQADLNGDGKVDIIDAVIITMHWTG